VGVNAIAMRDHFGGGLSFGGVVVLSQVLIHAYLGVGVLVAANGAPISPALL
jgi:hypothetical protein